MFEQLKMTSKVSEIKLVKLLVALVEKIHCLSGIVLFKLYCLLPKSDSVTTKLNLFRLVSAGLKEKKQADEYLFCFLNFIFHQLLITYNSITITLI